MVSALLAFATLLAAAPDLVSRELMVSAISRETRAPVRMRVKLSQPKDWTGDDELDASSIRLLGPNGEGEILVAVVMSPSALGEHLTRLKNAHPAAAPSPPMAIDVRGIDPERGERATRFVITGKEVGEMVMIERGGVIVLYATIVTPDAWTTLKPLMERCYPSVQVKEEAKLPVEKAHKR